MAGAEEFVRNIDRLANEVGTGRIVAGCDVDQIYAQNQHENLSFNHTSGTAHYLGGPLLTNAQALVAKIARSILDESGSHLSRGMRDVAEDMAGYVHKFAPKDPDIGDVLANSGSPWVRDNGVEVYRRPPVAPREAVQDHT